MQQTSNAHGFFWDQADSTENATETLSKKRISRYPREKSVLIQRLSNVLSYLRCPCGIRIISMSVSRYVFFSLAA
jgi:hypothetical protein